MTDTAYGRVTAPAEVRFERLLPGPIETVWEFLVDSDKRGQWLASGPMELKEGGAVELRFQHRDLSPHKVAPPERYKEMDETGHVSRERVLRVEPPRLLAISWDKSEVTFELVPEGKNVRLILTHRNLPNRADMVGTSGGWHTHLDTLVERVNGRVRRPSGRSSEISRKITRSAFRSKSYCGPASCGPKRSFSSLNTSRLRALVSRSMQLV